MLFVSLSAGVQSLPEHPGGWSAASAGWCNFFSLEEKAAAKSVTVFSLFWWSFIFLTIVALHRIWSAGNGRDLPETFSGTACFCSIHACSVDICVVPSVKFCYSICLLCVSVPDVPDSGLELSLWTWLWPGRRQHLSGEKTTGENIFFESWKCTPVLMSTQVGGERKYFSTLIFLHIVEDIYVEGHSITVPVRHTTLPFWKAHTYLMSVLRCLHRFA